MTNQRILKGEEGMALIVTLLVVLVIGALITGAAVVGANHVLVTRYYERQSILETAAHEGLELGRATLNADPTVYPAGGYTVLEDGVSVVDGSGTTISGVKRWTYAGPTGVTSGQYGVFGSILSVVKDAGGGTVIRRQQINQDSFAKYAYFTDVEPSNIRFGGGDAIWGPVHSNSPIRIWSSGATFYSTVRTAQTVVDGQYADFKQGYDENVSPIAMPATAELAKLRTQATIGGTHFIGDDTQGHGETTMRIEFVAIDLNGDGDRTDRNEAFIKVYQNTTNPFHVTAEEWSWGGSGADVQYSNSCGAVAPDGQFYTMNEYRNNVDGMGLGWFQAAQSANRRCYLGGENLLNNPDGFVANDAYNGSWVQYSPTPAPVVVAAVGITEAQYLHPINRPLNPNWKGVIMVDGKVAISGVVRGRITMAATNDIILADDYVYATDPGDPNRECADVLGIFSGDDIVVADNALNTSVPIGGDSWWQSPRTFDDTPGEFFQGVLLALDIFTVENYSSGPTNTEACDGNPKGRSCLYLTGGIIQKTRGAVGTSSGSGYTKRYAYDTCAAQSPPPYFPTTGHFARNEYFQIDPTDFNVSSYWSLITPAPVS